MGSNPVSSSSESVSRVLVGVGGGGEASHLCAALGMRVIGIDPRVSERPAGMADLATPDRLEEPVRRASGWPRYGPRS
jgi:phosphoglycerate dehydrogenase-like enzyme